MGYRLVITEKPSVASAIAKVIGAKERKDGYFQGGGYLVSWCVGHLVELAMPQAYDEKYGKWRKEDLPILPKKWKYQIYQSTKKQFQTLKSLMAVCSVLGFLTKNDDEIPAEITGMLKEREEARKNRDWKRSDELRDALKDAGYIVEDTKNGQKVRKNV